MKKPRIFVLSHDGDQDGFKWISDGWNSESSRSPSLMRKARKAIESGKDVPDVVRLLKKAGFEVVRQDFLVTRGVKP